MSWAYPRRVDDAISLVQTVFDEMRAKDVPFMAGSIAYSAFVSLLPLLLLALLVASVLGGELMVTYVMGITGAYLSPTGQSLLTNAITRAAGRTGLSIISVVVLVWGVLKVFRGLDTAFSTLYETHSDNDFLNQIQDGIIVLIAMGAALLAVIVAAAVFALFPRLPFMRVWNPLLLIVGLTIAFLPIYFVFPDTEVSVREVLPGAVVAAVGWTGLEAIFGLYVAYSSTAELYGVVGGVVLLITWLYFGALVLLIGAVTNVVLSGRARSVPTEAHSEPA